MTAVTGDKILSLDRLNSLQRAFVDSCTHGLIGLLTWLVVALPSKHPLISKIYEVFLCGFLSSLIDFDHFIAAKSFHLKDAVGLNSRPFLHCTSVPLTICVVVIVLSHVLGWSTLVRIPWLVLAALLSHHIRDGTRRGLWMWPFGSTPAIPYSLYVGATMALPHIIGLVLPPTQHGIEYHILPAVV
ncbi:unnamed protein product, partial [Timema podura]|nr:unnamed protein product [Timema podura]